MNGWVQEKAKVLAFQTLERGQPLYHSLIERGVSRKALDSFLEGPRERKSSKARPQDPRLLTQELIHWGGHIAGGAALRSWLYMKGPGDVDVFFNDYTTWVKATLAAYDNPLIDVCLFSHSPCEGFDIGISRCSYSSKGFHLEPDCKEALDTGVSSIAMDCIIQPVATLGRVAKYGSTYGVKFRRDQILEIWRKYRVTNASVVRAALAQT